MKKPGKERPVSPKDSLIPGCLEKAYFCYRVSLMSVSKDVPAGGDLCSEERQELCCFQTVLGPRGMWFFVWLRNSLLHFL